MTQPAAGAASCPAGVLALFTTTPAQQDLLGSPVIPKSDPPFFMFRFSGHSLHWIAIFQVQAHDVREALHPCDPEIAPVHTPVSKIPSIFFFPPRCCVEGMEEKKNNPLTIFGGFLEMQ